MSSSKQWRKMDGEKVVPKPVVQTQKVLLRLKEAVEQLIDREKAKKTAAQEHLHRMKHGGGA